MDPTDDVRVTAGLLAHHDPSRGLVVVHPTPAPLRSHVLAHDVLAALGRPVSRIDAEHLGPAKRAWAAAAAWMLTERVHDLVVLRADRLPAHALVRLLTLGRQTDARLLLVCHRPQLSDPLAAALTGLDHQVFRDVPDHLGDPEDPTPGPDRQRPTATEQDDLPSCSVIPGVAHYRAEMFRRLDPAGFARVDDAYLHGFDTACRWLRAHPSPGLTGVAQEQLQTILAELVHDSPTRRHTVTRLRGAQAGFLAHGLLLTVPTPPDLLGTLNGPGLNTVPVGGRLIDRIRSGVTHPVTAAGLATTLFTGIRPPALQYSSLTTDADAVRATCRPVGTGTRPGPVITALFPIPRAARPLLQAAHQYCRYLLPHPGRRLFTPAAMSTEQITAAAVACRIELPEQADLVTAWQARITCVPVDAPAPHSRSCTHPDWTTRSGTTTDRDSMTEAGCGDRHAPVPEPEFDDPPGRGRRPLTACTAAGVLQLLADHFRSVPARQRSTRNSARSWLMIRRQLAFYPRTADGGLTGEGLTPHPDVLFALRLADRPSEITAPDGPHIAHVDQ